MAAQPANHRHGQRYGDLRGAAGAARAAQSAKQSAARPCQAAHRARHLPDGEHLPGGLGAGPGIRVPLRRRAAEGNRRHGLHDRPAGGDMSISPAVVFPASEADVISELSCGEDETVRPLAGGTALALLARYGFLQPTRLVSLRNMRGKLGHISSSLPGTLRIGAMVTLTELARSPLLAQAATVLAAAAGLVANVRVRNVACLGGHLAHADPHMDLPPVLLALDARVEIRGPTGVRWSTVDDLVSGYYETTLGQQELITAVEVPVADGRLAVYSRYTAAAADDWPSAAVDAAMQSPDGRVAEPRRTVGAATPSPLRLTEAGALRRREHIVD